MPARALDNMLRELGVERVDLIKVDVEGAEYEALKGLEKTLVHENPQVVVELLKRDESKVVDYMESLGYVKRLLHVFLPFRGGLVFYQFEKSVSTKVTS